MRKRYENLTKPLKLRGKTMKSRLVYPVAQPHFLQASENYPADPVVSFLTSRAKNGAGLILMQDLTNQAQRRMGSGDTPHFCMYDLDDKGAQNGFTQLAEFVHYYGTLIVPELNLDNRMPLQVNDPAIPAPEGCGVPPFMMMPMEDDDEPANDKLGELSGAPGRPMANAKMMDEAAMEEYLRVTIRHAKAYRNLDFDGGLLDLAEHNFLLGKFFAPKYNWRTDEYGGSFENRARFPVRVIRALREAMGPDWLLVLNAPNTGEGLMSVEECAAFFRMVEKDVDLIQVRVMHPDHEPVTVCESAELSKRYKALGVKTPIAISTYYKDLDHLEEIVREGWADCLAPGHLFICNEHVGEILRDGNGEDLNPCIECHACRGTSRTGDWMSHCTINPELGMEHRAYRMIEPVTKRKKVAILGGGPGGMNCALWLKERGHTPVIFEASGELGGQVKSANYPKFKWELKRYLDFLKNQMIRKEIEVRLNTRATPEGIEAEGFDAVIAAVGATPKKPPVPGAEQAVWNGVNLYGRANELGQNVLVVGGASAAAEAAVYLAEQGKTVTELTRKRMVATDLNPIRMIGYMNQKVQRMGIRLIPGASLLRLEDHAAVYEKDGRQESIPFDDVILTGGMEPNQDAAIEFRLAAPEFYMIGDCRQAGNMRTAIRDAYAVAMRI